MRLNFMNFFFYSSNVNMQKCGQNYPSIFIYKIGLKTEKEGMGMKLLMVPVDFIDFPEMDLSFSGSAGVGQIENT